MRKLAAPSLNFFIFCSPAFLLFAHISRYVKISTEGCRIRLRKHLALAIFSTFWACFWAILVVYISRIIKHFVGAFEKNEKYKKFPFFYIYNLGKNVAF